MGPKLKKKLNGRTHIKFMLREFTTLNPGASRNLGKRLLVMVNNDGGVPGTIWEVN